MIIGIGIDIIKVSRINSIILRFGACLANKILNSSEYQMYKIHAQKNRYIAKCFAVKEAAAKALGTGFRYGLSFKEFEITKYKSGKPKIKLLNYAKLIAKKRGIQHIHASISDEKCYVLAIVIMES